MSVWRLRQFSQAMPTGASAAFPSGQVSNTFQEEPFAPAGPEFRKLLFSPTSASGWAFLWRLVSESTIFSELHGSFRSPDRCGALVLENNEVPCRSLHVAAGTPVIPMGLEGCCRSRVHVHVRPQSFGVCHGFNHGGHAVEKRIAVSQKENTAAGACRNTARPGGGCGRLFPGLERAGENCPGKISSRNILAGGIMALDGFPCFRNKISNGIHDVSRLFLYIR